MALYNIFKMHLSSSCITCEVVELQEMWLTAGRLLYWSICHVYGN